MVAISRVRSLRTPASAFGYYDDEPDQALVVQLKATAGSYCLVAFRGTSLTFDDWSQNIRIGNFDVCVDVAGEQKCCTSRIGFYDAYDTQYRIDVEESVRDCAKKCENPDECVVITGHSQGGAVASVAALILADLNPYVITFGQPPTLNEPCDLLTSDRIYRYVNTKTETGTTGIAYDPGTY
jgi:pimeloyl-ACP methyl ester carboxylesterase